MTDSNVLWKKRDETLVFQLTAMMQYQSAALKFVGSSLCSLIRDGVERIEEVILVRFSTCWKLKGRPTMTSDNYFFFCVVQLIGCWLN